MRLTNLDFDDDSDWDSSEVKYPTTKKRRVRQAPDEQVEATTSDGGGEEMDVTTLSPVVEVSSSVSFSVSSKSRYSEPTTPTESESSTEPIVAPTTNDDDDSATGTDILDPPENATTVPPPNDNGTKYSSRATLSEDDFVTIKVTDLEYDAPNDKLLIYLGTEMKKDIYYIVKVSFTGNMTLDKGLYYTQYQNVDNSTR
jgi:hypothetical protein